MVTVKANLAVVHCIHTHSWDKLNKNGWGAEGGRIWRE
jgi:hypothetical protein